MEKKWEKPELIVYRKGQSQESVLLICKSVERAGIPQTGSVGQNCGNPNVGSCSACQARPDKGS
jgi:hypothetical protein